MRGAMDGVQQELEDNDGANYHTKNVYSSFCCQQCVCPPIYSILEELGNSLEAFVFWYMGSIILLGQNLIQEMAWWRMNI
jgi:hypothetical protein